MKTKKRIIFAAVFIVMIFSILPNTYVFANPESSSSESNSPNTVLEIAPVSSKSSSEIEFASSELSSEVESTLIKQTQDTQSPLDAISHNDDVYLVNTVNDLIIISNVVNSGNNLYGYEIKLMDDIDFQDNLFSPIGNSNSPFRGNFDGNNHTINNLKIDVKDGSYSGFFGYIGPYGIVRNLTLENANINGNNNYTGGIAGYNCGLIDHCCFKGSVFCFTDDMNINPGGIVGYNTCDGYINNCRVAKYAKITKQFNDYLPSSADYIYGSNGGKVIQCRSFFMYPW